MADRSAKAALFDAFATVAKALASGRRAEIVDVLANGERSVESLAEELGMTVANVSQHLQVLRRACLVSARREGTFVHYSLASREVVAFWRSLQEIATRQLPEVERLARAYVGGREGLEPITKEELVRRMDVGEDVVVLDVRPAAEYAAGHIAGAVSIPLPELERRLRELPASKEVVAYCRGPYCAFAPEAVRLLRAKGVNARPLTDGLPEWAAAGFPIAP